MIDDFESLLDGLRFVAAELAAGGQAAVMEWELLPGERGQPPLHDEDLVLAARVAAAAEQPQDRAVGSLAEQVALRFQSYEEQVERLERLIAAGQDSQA